MRSVEVIDTKVNKKLHYQNIVELRICIFPFLNLQWMCIRYICFKFIFWQNQIARRHTESLATPSLRPRLPRLRPNPKRANPSFGFPGLTLSSADQFTCPAGQDVVVGRRRGAAVPLYADAVEGAPPAEPAVGVRRGGARRALQALRPHRQHQKRRWRQPQPGLRRVRKSFPRPFPLPSSRPYPIDPHRDPIRNSGQFSRRRIIGSS